MKSSWLIVGGWIAFATVVWLFARPAILPSPLEVLNAFPALWFDEGLGQDMVASLQVSLEALAFSVAVSLSLTYLCAVRAQTIFVDWNGRHFEVRDLFLPVAQGVSQLRFLSPSVYFIILLFLSSTGHMVKVLMLTIGETVFLVNSMLTVVTDVPDEKFDECRMIRMSEWTATYYAVVRGTWSQALDAIQSNNAMGWSMLPMVEGIVRSDGGIGVLIANNDKHMNFPEVYAAALAILIAGLLLDFAIEETKRITCPHLGLPSRLGQLGRLVGLA